MSPKAGRPKAENPMGKRFGVRLDASTQRKLQEYCYKHNISISEAIRRAINLLLIEKK
jgi:hypothetical protein